MSDWFPTIDAGKRLGVRRVPSIGDWFTSWSPRNDNVFAEGEWDQWADLAIKILQHPYTQATRPEAHEAVKNLAPRNYYNECDAPLTQEHFEANEKEQDL